MDLRRLRFGENWADINGVCLLEIHCVAELEWSMMLRLHTNNYIVQC